jgi:hypothetical protein
MLEKTPWLDFLDDDGWHLCQPDGILRTDAGVFVLEMKLRQNWQGYEELRHLYLPVVSRYLGAPVRGLLVCWALQSRMQDWLFMGPDARIDDLPDDEIGTWFLRV